VSWLRTDNEGKQVAGAGFGPGEQGGDLAVDQPLGEIGIAAGDGRPGRRWAVPP